MNLRNNNKSGNEYNTHIREFNILSFNDNLPELREEITAALKILSSLEKSEELREHAINNGKAVIANWQPPTDEQINKIFLNIKEEILNAG